MSVDVVSHGKVASGDTVTDRTRSIDEQLRPR